MAIPSLGQLVLLRRLIACLLLLLAVAAAPQGAAAAEVKDDVMQANLFFPQENATYQPVYPFPIVFSVQNAKLAWQSNLWISWTLNDLHTNSMIDNGSIRREASGTANETDPPPDDQWIVIHHASDVVNTTYTELKLYLTFGISDGCDREHLEDYGTARPALFEDRVLHESIRFNLSADGSLPDIEKAGPCPAVPIGAIKVEDFHAASMGLACPLLGNSQDDPHPIVECPASIGAEAATLVADEMLAVASCTDGTWPDPTGMKGPCPSDSAGRRRVSSGGALEAIVVMSAVVILGGHSLGSIFY